ncbi:MAG TPA: MFS transporter [Solirubrobacteraceae bacterium]|nr:MFS transporter [Solirubrobacteraceae bacterium]
MSTTSPASLSADAPDPRRWRALILLCAAQFMVVLDASIVNVALPSIKTALSFSQADLQWVVNAYTLTFGGFLLLGGRAADLLGRRRVFMFGLGVFSLASLLGGLAQSEAWLIVARGVQGLGAAILSPAALSIVTTTFTEGEERNKALGIWGALAGGGGAAGVLLGGLLTSGIGWEWVLFVNVPIGVLAIILVPRLIRESRAEGANEGYDVAGAVTITAGLMLLVYTLVKTTSVGWGATQTIVLMIVSALLIVAFVVIEARAHSPLMPLGIFRKRSISSANAVGLLVGASLFSMFFFISLYLQEVLRFSALKSGVSYLPLSLGIILSAGAASVLVNRIGAKLVMVAGLVLVAIGLVLFTQVSADGSFAGDVLAPSVIVAVGLGLSFVPLTILAVSGVSHQEAGLASGLINTAQQVGGAIGLAILSTVAASRTSHLLSAAHGAPSERASALTSGFSHAFGVGAGFAILGVVIAVLFVGGRDQTPPSGATAEAPGEEQQGSLATARV